MSARIQFLFVIPVLVQCNAYAGPPFFEARSDKERCQAVAYWEDAITIASNGGAANLRSEQIAELAARSYHNAIGREFSQLSDSQKQNVAKFLRKCGKEAWVSVILAGNFEKLHSADARNFARMLEKYAALPRRAPSSGQRSIESRTGDALGDFEETRSALLRSSETPEDYADEIRRRRQALMALFDRAREREKAAQREADEFQRATLKSVEAASAALRRGRQLEVDELDMEKRAFEIARTAVRRELGLLEEFRIMRANGIPSVPELFTRGLKLAETARESERAAAPPGSQALASLAQAISGRAPEERIQRLTRVVTAYATARKALSQERQLYDAYQVAIGAPTIAELERIRSLEEQRMHALRAYQSERQKHIKSDAVVVGAILATGAVLLPIVKYFFMTEEEARIANQEAIANENESKRSCEARGGRWLGGTACLVLP